MWHRIACRVGCHPWDARRKTSATGFHRWAEFFDREMNERTPECWYLAQIAAALHSIPAWVWGKSPPEAFTKVETFLLRFTDGSDRPEVREKTEEELREEATAASKAAGWGLVLAAKPSGAPRTLPPGIADISGSTTGTTGTPAPPPQSAPDQPISPPQHPETPRKRARVDMPARKHP